MHPCPGTRVAIGCAVVHFSLVHELNGGTVFMNDINVRQISLIGICYTYRERRMAPNV